MSSPALTADVVTGPSSAASSRAEHARPRALVITFWIATVLLCLQMGFTAYAQLSLPQVAEAFAHMGFPGYFRVELSYAKLLGIVALLAPVPARLKEWAYAGFAITLVSALVAHVSVGDGAQAWGFAAGTIVLWALSYGTWRRLSDHPRAPAPAKASLAGRRSAAADACPPPGMSWGTRRG